MRWHLREKAIAFFLKIVLVKKKIVAFPSFPKQVFLLFSLLLPKKEKDYDYLSD